MNDLNRNATENRRIWKTAEIEALFQRAGYHKQLDVVGYQGLLYALYDPGRWEAVDVLRWLKEFTAQANANGIKLIATTTPEAWRAHLDGHSSLMSHLETLKIEELEHCSKYYSIRKLFKE